MRDKLYPGLLENNKFIYALLGFVLLFILIVRIHLLSFPFERDEGEYAYIGNLILQGHPPYTMAYNMKLPGTYYMYAIIMSIFGKSANGVHLGLAFMSLASMFFVFNISKNFVSNIGALITAASFGILGTSYTLKAQAAHATHFVIFFALIGVYIILKIYRAEKKPILHYFISGLFFSLAFICKQSGLFFVFFGASVILIKEFYTVPIITVLKKLSIFFLGFALPVSGMLLYFYFFADFGKFWFWTVTYLSTYSNQISSAEIPEMFKLGLSNISANFSPAGYIYLWFISLIGIPLVAINKTTKQNKILIFSFFLFSFLSVIPGFHFRSHYFIAILPAVAISIGIFFDVFSNFIIIIIKKPYGHFIGLFIFLIFIGSGINANSTYLFNQRPTISCKQVYGSNPFVESIEISEFLKKNTTRKDKIAIIGSEPQILFYANRYSATSYIYTYGLVELHPYALIMQKEMIKEIELNKPAYLLFIDVATSWVSKPNSERFIFDWASQYIRQNYKLVRFCEVLPDSISTIKISTQLTNHKPQSSEIIYIYERVK